jgi:hypothetical protein
MVQLLLLLLVLVGIGLAVWAFVATSPKKNNKEKGKGKKNDDEENGKGNNEENGKGNNSENGGSNNNGGIGECKWKEYVGKDNDGVSPCDDDKCRLKGITEKECKRACCEMEECKAVQWRTDGRCLLKHSVGDIDDAAEEKTLFVKE